MSTSVETAIDIRPFHVEFPEEELAELRRRIAATRWPSRELVADRSQGVQLATLQALARYWATEYDWRKAEAKLNALAAVHHRDRWGGHPLHPRQVGARGRAAADHDPRLARLGDRVARLGRPADGPDRVWRQRRGCVPSRAALAARATGSPGEPVEVGWDLAGRPGLGRADAPTRLQPLRRSGRRRGRGRHRRDGPPGARGPASASTRTCSCRRWAAPMPTDTDEERAAAAQIAHLREVRKRLLRRDGDPSADDRLRAARFSRRSWPPG